MINMTNSHKMTAPTIISLIEKVSVMEACHFGINMVVYCKR